jgi:hypothetical protein
MDSMYSLYNDLLKKDISCVLNQDILQIVGSMKGHSFTIYYHQELLHPSHAHVHSKVVLKISETLYYPKDSEDVSSLLLNVKEKVREKHLV